MSLRAVAAALVLVATGARGQQATLDFVSPPFDRAALGTVVVELELRSAGASVDLVVVLVDGLVVGELHAAPWRLVADVGTVPGEHRFEAIAYRDGVPVAAAALRTPGLATHDEITVRLKPLFVTVRRGGELLGDLGREAFSILDRGRPQPIVTFERGDVPFSAVLMIDSSGSMRGDRLRLAVEAAQRFVAALAPFDEAKLILFSHRLLLETPFTSVPAVLGLGLEGVEATGGTAVNDHLYLAIHRLEERRGRRVAVLLSDGGDVESVLRMERVRALASQRDVVVYWLRLRREQEGRGRIRRSSSWRDVDAHDRELELLRQLVVESGGRETAIDGVEDAAARLDELLGELRGQYVLGYAPDWNEAGWHDVEVIVDRRSTGGRADVQAPRGYLVPRREPEGP